jgi:FMN reductase
MPKQLIVTIAGSPSQRSRSSVLLRESERLLAKAGVATQSIVVRDLPAEDLIHGRHDSASIKAAAKIIDEASAVVIATPIYKAALSGVLKAFLDLLGQNALQGKIVLPIAVGGTNAHLLAVDYSLRPVLSVLGATQVLGTVYAIDSQIRIAEDGAVNLDPEIGLRLAHAIRQLADALRPPRAAPDPGLARSFARIRGRSAIPSLEG